MNVDDLFGVLLLFISVLAALFFMIALIRKEAILVKQKVMSKDNSKSKFYNRNL